MADLLKDSGGWVRASDGKKKISGTRKVKCASYKERPDASHSEKEWGGGEGKELGTSQGKRKIEVPGGEREEWGGGGGKEAGGLGEAREGLSKKSKGRCAGGSELGSSLRRPTSERACSASLPWGVKAGT